MGRSEPLCRVPSHKKNWPNYLRCVVSTNESRPLQGVEEDEYRVYSVTTSEPLYVLGERGAGDHYAGATHGEWGRGRQEGVPISDEVPRWIYEQIPRGCGSHKRVMNYY